MTPEGPFSPVYSRQSFLETPGLGGVLRRLDDGLGAREPFLIVTGGPGTGKTALAHEAVARWGPRVTAAFVAYPALTGTEFLEEIIRRFGAEPPDGASRSKLVACIERALTDITGRSQVAMLVVDDAHGLSLELLEELRLLVNAAQQVRRPLEILLLGLPTLETRLDEPALAALRQRISVHAKVEPLSAAEVRRYLHHRVTSVGGDGPGLFSRKTCRDIAARTSGVPRQINALAAESLRIAYAWSDPTVAAEHVQTAAAALWGSAPTQEIASSDDAGAEDSPAPMPALTTASTSVFASIPALQSQPSPKPQTSVDAPAPAAERATAAPARKVAVSAPAPKIAAPAPAEAVVPPPPVIPAHHDPREWVARFIGEQGPIQISSRALPEPTWEPEPPAASDAKSSIPSEELSPHRDQRDRERPRWRSRHRIDLRAATTALLAAIIVASAIVLVVRVRSLASGGAGQAAGVTTSASATADAGKESSTGKAPSPGPHRAGARTTEATSSAGEGEHPLASWAAKSRGPYTLDVGGASEIESAVNQRNRLQRLTGFEGWVISAANDGGKPYRIVVGIYRSEGRAAAVAEMLMRSRTLHHVTVVPLPPKNARL